MPTFLHADDYGCTRGVTDNILACVDAGTINSVSLLANGLDLDRALDEYKRRQGMRLCIHLNLVERNPIAGLADVPLLVDSAGDFRHGFVSLWGEYLRGSPALRRQLYAQVKRELGEQIRLVRGRLGKDHPVLVDSHLHFHMIPFVFRALMELHEEHGFAYVRLPREPRYFGVRELGMLGTRAASGVLKHGLLRGLSRWVRPQLRRRGIASCDRFLGVLFSGRMTVDAMKSVVRALRGSEREVVEVVFHPGGGKPGEEHVWERQPELLVAYFSPWREREREALLAPGFRELLPAVAGYLPSTLR